MSLKAKEIPREEWATIRDMYLKDWPKHSITYFYIDHALKHEQFDVKLYSYQEDYSDGTVLYVNRSYEMVHPNTLSNDIEKLKEIVNEINGIDLRFIFITAEILSPIVDYITSLTDRKYDQPLDVFLHLDKSKALELEIPNDPNIILKAVTVEDAEVINNHWPHRYPGSLQYVSSLIETDYSVGAFDKETGELMAWVLRYPTGCSGVLQVKEKYFRRGLGKLVTMALAKKLAQDGIDSISNTIHNNAISRKLFKSVGFSEIQEMYLYEWV